MEALFTNNTEIEKVASFTAMGHEKRTKRSSLVIIATAVMVAIALTMVFMIPSEYRVIAGIAAAVLFGTGIVMMWLKAPGGKPSTSISDLGLIRTGDSEKYSYEFFDRSFSVTRDEKKEYEYSAILSVRDIGGAYQIKTQDASYTVKKAGFSEGGANRFKALMESCGVIIK